jgi:hypothetical protein
VKNKLLTLASALALLAALGKFYAIPAVAQATRAALVQDRDSPPREPFSIQSNLPGGTALLNFPGPPAGKRMVITSVTAIVDQAGTTDVLFDVGASSEGRAYRYEYVLQHAGIFTERFFGTFPSLIVLDPDGSGQTAFTVQGANTTILDSQITLTGYYIVIP